MPYQLAIKDIDLFEQLNQLIDHSHWNRLTLSKLTYEAKRLLKSNNRIDGYMALGTLASLEGQLESIHMNYKKAMELSPRNSIVIANYAISLGRVGYFSKAADLMLDANHLSKERWIHLGDALYFCGIAGRFHQVGKLLELWNKINPRRSHSLNQLAPEMIGLMDRKQVSDAELERLIIATISVLHHHAIYIGAHHIQMSLFKEGHSKWFHYGILVLQSVDKVIDLDFELADKIREGQFQKNMRDSFKPSFEAIGE